VPVSGSVTDTVVAPVQNAPRAIAFILVAMLCISVNDMLFKLLSGGYPLHQMVFVRALVGICASLVFLRLEGGWRLLRTDRPVLHGVRAAFIVLANMLFFAALSAMPLGAATALFFVAPLFITLLAIPVLGEPVGRQRLAAVAVGLLGVAVMAAPGVDWGEVPRWALSLPVLAAACYAGMQVLTRKLGAGSAASAMAIYIQGAFILVSLGFWAVAGDGRYAEGLGPGPAEFLLRAWIWPERGDLWVFGVLGLPVGDDRLCAQPGLPARHGLGGGVLRIRGAAAGDLLGLADLRRGAAHGGLDRHGADRGGGALGLRAGTGARPGAGLRTARSGAG
jgi:S-adenosylmethionine uptake transporter